MAYSNPKFNPGTATLRFARRASAGRVPTGSVWRDMRTRSVAYSPDFKTVQPTHLDASGLASPGLPTKIDGTFPLPVELSFEDHLLLLAGVQRRASVTEVEAGVAYRHKLAPTETGTDASFLVAQQDRSNGLIENVLDVAVQSALINLKAGELVTADFTLLPTAFHRWAGATQSAGASTKPELRGLLGNDLWNAADSDVYLKVLDASGLPDSILVQAKVGAAASFAGAGFEVFPARWTDIFDGSGFEVGAPGAFVQVYWPDFTDIADDDIFRINSSMPQWTQALPTEVVMNEIEAVVRIDGTDFAVSDIQLSITNQWQANPNVGGRFGSPPVARGTRATTWAINRESIDTSLIERLETGVAAEIVVLIRSSVFIGASVVNRYRAVFTSLNCTCSGTQVAATSPTDFKESVTFTAARSDDGTYPSDVTIEITNSTPAV